MIYILTERTKLKVHPRLSRKTLINNMPNQLTCVDPDTNTNIWRDFGCRRDLLYSAMQAWALPLEVMLFY